MGEEEGETWIQADELWIMTAGAPKMAVVTRERRKGGWIPLKQTSKWHRCSIQQAPRNEPVWAAEWDFCVQRNVDACVILVHKEQERAVEQPHTAKRHTVRKRAAVESNITE